MRRPPPLHIVPSRRPPSPRVARLAAGAMLAGATVAGCAGRGTVAPSADGQATPHWAATLHPRGSAAIPAGSAVLGAASGERQSVAVISLEGAPGSGAVLAWRLVEGGCDGSGQVLGGPGHYPVIQLRADGTGHATATLPIALPTRGIYSVRLFASPTDLSDPIACGELRLAMG